MTSTSTLRRNTFVISDFPPAPVSSSQTSGMERQNAMRLKVNRIALVQELRVEHVLGALARHGVVTETDFRQIQCGRTPQDRARILVDLLPGKSKDCDWYRCFRAALLSPEGSGPLKPRYRHLVEFLDNTVIHRPTSQAAKFSEAASSADKARYPRHQPLPHIRERPAETNVLRLDEEGEERGGGRDLLGVAADLEKMSLCSTDSHKPMMLVKGFFHQWIPTPDNFKSLIDFPKELRQSLEEINTPEANAQIGLERAALHTVQRLEVISALSQRRQLPAGFELCLCDTGQELLGQPHLFHLYLKHLRTLQEAGVHLPRDMAASYSGTLTTLASDPLTSLLRPVVQTGFRLADLLVELEAWSLAQEVVRALLAFLRDIPAISTWMDEYHAHVRLMSVSNACGDLRAAQQAYFAATQMTYQVRMVSFGQSLMTEGPLHQQLSALMLEYGSIQSALSWARKALQGVDPEDPRAVVEVVTQAVLAHCAVWQVKKAHTLAVFALQFAREQFGRYHPMYLKALSSLCHVCNEFQQDSAGVTLAQELVTTAELVYGGGDSLQLAAAHHTLSKALMAQRSRGDDYYHHAMEALRLARSQLTEGHARLHPYLANFALALQWKSLQCPKEVQESTLQWAETEARQALALARQHHGDTSLRAALTHALLGQIYSKMNHMSAAEHHLRTAVDHLQLCQPASGHHLLLAHATLGTFLAMQGHHLQALPHLTQVPMYVESTGHYLKWVHVCFQTLISLLQTEGTAFTNTEEADRLQVHLSLWLKDNPKDNSVLDTSELTAAPPLFQDFMDKFDTWGSAVLKVQNLKDTMKTAALFGTK
ncbi:hypothetical protein ACOMHN_009576 [Nucella lapillus]